MDKQTFKDIRHFKKMTQRQFADWLGIGIQSVAMIETGQRNISDNIRGKLAHKFEMTDDFSEYRERKSRLIG